MEPYYIGKVLDHEGLPYYLVTIAVPSWMWLGLFAAFGPFAFICWFTWMNVFYGVYKGRYSQHFIDWRNLKKTHYKDWVYSMVYIMEDILSILLIQEMWKNSLQRLSVFYGVCKGR